VKVFRGFLKVSCILAGFLISPDVFQTAPNISNIVYPGVRYPGLKKILFFFLSLQKSICLIWENCKPEGCIYILGNTSPPRGGGREKYEKGKEKKEENMMEKDAKRCKDKIKKGKLKVKG
jgi:hypothetical protein